MIRWMGMLTLTALLALTPMGCRKSQPGQADANTTTAEQLKDTAGQALQEATRLLARQKERLLATSQEQLNNLERQVDEWLDEATSRNEQVKQQLTSLGERFRGALGEARQVPEQAGTDGLDAWQETKPAVEAAVRKVQQAHARIIAYLKDLARKETQESLLQPGSPVIIE